MVVAVDNSRNECAPSTCDSSWRLRVRKYSLHRKRKSLRREGVRGRGPKAVVNDSTRSMCALSTYVQCVGHDDHQQDHGQLEGDVLAEHQACGSDMHGSAVHAGISSTCVAQVRHVLRRGDLCTVHKTRSTAIGGRTVPANTMRNLRTMIPIFQYQNSGLK